MKNLELAFMSQGFNNWKKACEKFEAHESSEAHKEAIFTVKQLRTSGIDAQLNNQVQKTQASRRDIKELSCLRMLLRQGLPIRGQTEQEGNLMQSLCLRSNDDPRIIQWIKDSKYLSVDIVNECVMLMDRNCLESFLVTYIKLEYFLFSPMK